MCGITGFVDKKNKLTIGKRTRIVKDMLSILNHRGGDAIGVETYGLTTTGHTRLSIVDIDKRANQPLTNDRAILSFNGEIYNHKNLRNKYIKYRLDSYSDTATLFELLQLLPVEKVLKIIHGMYAFIHINKQKNILTLASDKFSIKPLYYINTPEYFAWASEVKAFKVIPGFRFKLNTDCLEEYLIYRYVAGERTLFNKVNKLQSGELVQFDLNGGDLKRIQYYDIFNIGYPDNFTEKILKNSVHNQLMSDMPVGIQLSGGVDSSLIAIFAKQFSKYKLSTFSIGLSDEKWNEFDYSDLIAKKLRTDHHKIVFSKNDFSKLLPKITYHLDEPLVHPNTIPIYILAKEARKYTKVLLTGEGADEIFYGYSRYFDQNLQSNNDILFSNSFNTPASVSKIIKKGGSYLKVRTRILRNIPKHTKFDAKISYYDLHTYLPHVLQRQDKAGMAANIENRVPFLYESVAESAFYMQNRVGEFGGKTPLKKIALKYLSRDFVLRRKCGFGLPIANWLRKEGSPNLDLSRLAKHSLIKKYFKVREIKKLCNEHISKNVDNSVILFSLISLMIWYDVFIGYPKK